jgi:segregation and condensation protein B
MADDTASRIEAFLFTEGGSLSLKRLASLMKMKEADLSPCLDELAKRLEGHGLTLIRTASEASLAVASDASQSVKSAYQHDLERDIGDAGLEVLAIVLYRGPSTRSQIDYIRGVNTSSTIRNLLARGLLERIGNPEDGREYLYRPTVELLAHLGVRDIKELPEYEKTVREIATFETKPQEGTDTTHGTTD